MVSIWGFVVRTARQRVSTRRFRQSIVYNTQWKNGQVESNGRNRLENMSNVTILKGSKHATDAVRFLCKCIFMPWTKYSHDETRGSSITFLWVNHLISTPSSPFKWTYCYETDNLCQSQIWIIQMWCEPSIWFSLDMKTNRRTSRIHKQLLGLNRECYL